MRPTSEADSRSPRGPQTVAGRRWSGAPRRRRSGATAAISDYRSPGLDKSARSELLHMMGLVAAIVAIVILVFFGLGYLFGRLFL